MKKLALYGGSFDPVHVGHLLVAEAALDEIGLDRLIFVPAKQSPFKPDQQILAAPQRARLLRLALAGHAQFGIDLQEIERQAPSYAVQTVRHYQERHPGTELFYLIGADHVPTLSKWREADYLAQAVEFIVIPRPGEEISCFPPGFRGRVLNGFPIRLSSSQIRERIRQGLSIRHLVPEVVAEAIQNNRLYL